MANGELKDDNSTYKRRFGLVVYDEDELDAHHCSISAGGTRVFMTLMK